MSFTLHQLNIFAAVAEHKSMTRASEELQMSQPSVSIQVKKLQEHFGIELFEVIGKQLYLTQAGQELYEAQKKISREMKNINMMFSELKGSLKGNLHIAVVSTSKYFMPYLLGAFQKKHKEIDISLKVTDRIGVVEQLKQNKCDFAVFSQLPDGLELEFQEFLENPLVMAAPPGHHLAGKKHNFKDLKEEDFLIREPGSGTRLVMERLFKKHKMDPDFVMELGSNEAVKQAIMAGIGISLISDYSVKLEKQMNHISILEVDTLPYINTWKLVFLKGKKLSPVARNFLNFTTASSVENLILNTNCRT